MSFRPIVDEATFRRAVQVGHTEESRFLDFKAMYPLRKKGEGKESLPDQAEELCRDVAQFANRDGGTLLVGVGEKDTTGRTVAGDVHGIADVEAFKKWAEQAIRKHLAPSTFSRSLDTVVLPEGNVVAVNVRPSLHLVALWHKDGKKGIEYVYRTDHGKEWMNPDEVERHLMNSSRATQIALNDVLDDVSKVRGDHFPVDLTPPMRPWVTLGSGGSALYSGPGEVFLRRPGCTNRVVELSVNVAGTPVSIKVPHGLIGDVWAANDGRVGLCLKVAIVVRGERELGLEPFTALA